jgi:hypothetical protein
MFDVGNQIITMTRRWVTTIFGSERRDQNGLCSTIPLATPPMDPTGTVLGVKTQRQLAPLRVPNQPKSEGNLPICPTSLRPVSCTETYYPGYPWFLVVLPHLQSVTVIIWEHWSVLAALLGYTGILSEI